MMTRLAAAAAVALGIGCAFLAAPSAEAAGAAVGARSAAIQAENSMKETVHYRRRHWRHYGGPYLSFGFGPRYYGGYSYYRPRHYSYGHYYRPYYRGYAHHPRYYRW